ncbi:hypothetical protein ATCCBAA256_09940 [Mycobacterium montefiorense]|nr:hypothetical protein ATCCBAA256_09940 [Mycobacterium montefiorense]
MTTQTPDHRTAGPLTRSNVAAVVDSQIRPLLHIHGGDLEVLSVSDQGVVRLCFHAACRACPLKMVTYAISIRQRLMEIPGVTDVVMDDVRLSRTAIARVEAAYRDHPLDLRSYANDRSPTEPDSEPKGESMMSFVSAPGSMAIAAIALALQRIKATVASGSAAASAVPRLTKSALADSLGVVAYQLGTFVRADDYSAVALGTTATSAGQFRRG